LHLQRPQIATMKAVGYSDREVGVHYLQLVTIIAFAGAALGTAGGAWLGRGMMGLYEPYFRYPDYGYRLDAGIVATAVLLTFGAGLAGAIQALYRAVRLPPAEAMRPEAPPSYQASLVERLGLGRLLAPSGRMVLRELTRRPWRTSLSILGIALATAILIASRFSYDAVDSMMALEFETAQRQDITVAMAHPISESARRDLARWPGVLAIEPIRIVGVRLRAGARKRDVGLTGLAAHSQLQRVVEWPEREIPLPEQGLVLTDKLAEILGVGVGDAVRVELLEGDRRERVVPVAALAHELLGLQAHMSLSALRALLDEEDVINAVALTVDPKSLGDLEQRLKKMPTVASVTSRRAVIERFHKQMAENMNVTTFILVLFAGSIAVGIVYNNARIALSMRSRDLASLRVLGFTRAEISSVLLGELGTTVVLSLPVGLLIGTWLAHLVGGMADPEMYRFPVIVSGRTYAFAVVVTLGAALFSALLVRRKLDHLDLIGVLKTRE
jgi:putative ABC transport system permease protein